MGQNGEEVPTTFGPKLALKAPEFFVAAYKGGGGIVLPSPFLCIFKIVRFLWGIQICMQNSMTDVF